MMRTRAFLLVSLLLTACGGVFTLVQPDSHTAAGTYSVKTPNAWSRAQLSKGELWTVDGPLLQRLTFYVPVRDGGTLGRPAQGKVMPAFRAGMTDFDARDLVVDTLAAQGYSRVESASLRPFDFGGLPGFRFELTFTNESGLVFDGTVAGAIADQRLYLIMYTGAQTHYFPRFRDEVEQIFDSVELNRPRRPQQS